MKKICEKMCRIFLDLYQLFYGGSQPATQDMNDRTSGAPYSSYCIYGEDKEDADVMNNYIICDGCRARMQAQASRFSHN